MTITATPSKAGAKVRKKSHICKHMQDFFSFIREDVFNRLKGLYYVCYRFHSYHPKPPPPGPPPELLEYEDKVTDEPPLTVAG